MKRVLLALTGSLLVATLATPADARESQRRATDRPAVAAPAPTQALADANAEARRRPNPQAFVDATTLYEYAPGALYELYAAPEFLSTILLEEGETLKTKAAGDTARWMVEAVPAAGGRDGRTLVMVKPTRAGIRTNIVLVTDRRTYLIEAIALANANGRAQTYSAQIAWRYPAAVKGSASNARAALGAPNFRYRIDTTRGRRPAWAPDRVFDDGARTFIEFPSNLATSEAPPLFIIGPEGAELVNYRVDGNRYIVDRLFDAAELRLGDRRPVVVRVARQRHVTGGRP
ncbi:MAG: TrbG/VirB9 family P-type conjugative transfer protein [Caulobacterales bacterium]